MGLDTYRYRIRITKPVDEDFLALEQIRNPEIIKHLSVKKEIPIMKKYGHIEEFETAKLNPDAFNYVEKDIVWIKENGYCRRRENSNFHKDGIWNSKAITKLDDLLDTYEKYFEDTDKDGCFFYDNIVKGFVEGKDIVMFA